MAEKVNIKTEKLDNDFENFKKEIVKMAGILLKLGTDSYLQMKYMLLADAAAYFQSGTMEFFEDLFEYTDKNRPLLLEMKRG